MFAAHWQETTSLLIEVSLVSWLQINTIKHKPKIFFLYGMCIKKEDVKFSKGKAVLTS